MRISDWSSDVCSSDLHILAAEARVHAARLEIAAVRAARNLAVAVLPRQPDFEVIGLARGEAHVAAAEQHFPVGQFERLEDCFGGARLALDRKSTRLNSSH